jgi:hypothetical protein
MAIITTQNAEQWGFHFFRQSGPETAEKLQTARKKTVIKPMHSASFMGLDHVAFMPILQ